MINLTMLRLGIPLLTIFSLTGCTPESQVSVIPREACAAPANVEVSYRGNGRLANLSALPATSDIAIAPGEVVFRSDGGNDPFSGNRTTTLRAVPTTFTVTASVGENVTVHNATVRAAFDRPVGIGGQFCPGSVITNEILPDDVSPQMVVSELLFNSGVEVDVTSPTGLVARLGGLGRPRSTFAVNGSPVVGRWTVRRVAIGSGDCSVAGENPSVSLSIQAACPVSP